jgi:periplasmic protein TonB
MREAFLKGCLVDGERGSTRRRRAKRQSAVLAAVGIEALIVAGLALWPLLTPGTPPPALVLLAHVPYSTNVVPLRSAPTSAADSPSRRAFMAPDFSRPVANIQVVPHSASLQNEPVPMIGSFGPGAPDGGPGVPFGSGNEAVPIAPPKPPVVRVIRRGESVQESQLINRVIPTYPEIARAARIAGTVELVVLVGRDGRVLSLEVLSGNPLLVASAKQAVAQWRYHPAILDGEAVEVESRVTVNFILDE